MTPAAKRLRFVRSYLVDGNAKKAAIKAGYSKATASAAGSRLLKHPDVVAALDLVRGTTPKASRSKRGKTVTPPSSDEQVTPLRYMLDVVNDPSVDRRVRLEAARSAAPYVHARLGLSLDAKIGKKAEKSDAAKSVASRFAPNAPPRLAAADGKKL